MSRVSKAMVGAALGALCAALIAAPAQAKKRSPVTGGQATVKMSSEVMSFLHSQGITVTAVGPASMSQGSVTIPMVSGRVAVPSMRGTMVTRGGLKFTGPKRTLVVHGYRLTHHGRHASLSAVVAGRRIVTARVASPQVHMSGKRGSMSGGLSMSAAWARLVDKLLGKHVVSRGEDMGDLSATVKIG